MNEAERKELLGLIGRLTAAQTVDDIYGKLGLSREDSKRMLDGCIHDLVCYVEALVEKAAIRAETPEL